MLACCDPAGAASLSSWHLGFRGWSLGTRVSGFGGVLLWAPHQMGQPCELGSTYMALSCLTGLRLPVHCPCSAQHAPCSCLQTAPTLKRCPRLPWNSPGSTGPEAAMRRMSRAAGEVCRGAAEAQRHGHGEGQHLAGQPGGLCRLPVLHQSLGHCDCCPNLQGRSFWEPRA